METTVNENAEVTKTSKNYHDTLSESIAKMKLTFGNATLPEIFTVMVTVGYTAEKVADLNSKLSSLEALCQGQTKEYADQSAEQQKFSDKRTDVNKLFVRHRDMSRILFKGNSQARVALQLDVEIPKAYADWLLMATNFYAQLTANADLQSQTTDIGITSAVVATQKQAIAEVQGLKESLRKETSEAQAATEARDRAFDLLYPQYSDYIKYAKILLPDNQALEAIGIKVKSN